MTNQLYLRSYIVFVKWSSFATPRTELVVSVNLFLCTSSGVLVVKNHLNQGVEVQYLFDITSLGPALFSDDISIGSTGNNNLRINFVIDIWSL